MNKPQILIKNGNNWFEFSKSKTGQLDYEGLWNKNDFPNVDEYQEIASSAYFSPSWYIYLQDAINNNSKVFVSPETDVSDADLFAYLIHIGPLLAAVEAKDSLLAGELYLRRRKTFEAFSPLTQYIMKPLSVEILFSLVYGRMNNIEADTIPLIFNNAKKKLGYNSAKESLDQAFMRYFKENSVTLTLETVGTAHHSWEPYSEVLDNMANNLSADDLFGAAEKIKKAKHQFFNTLEAAVQAEPYNPVDKNAIAVLIENIESKITGNPGLEKAGYVRAVAAKIIRESKPEKMSFNGKLVRLSNRDIIVQVNI
ncbi:MAG: hypothetical protein MJ188_11415 [Treponema sp.]|nr:hypothetical protein [Treponema sp.]